MAAGGQAPGKSKFQGFVAARAVRAGRMDWLEVAGLGTGKMEIGPAARIGGLGTGRKVVGLVEGLAAARIWELGAVRAGVGLAAGLIVRMVAEPVPWRCAEKIWASWRIWQQVFVEPALPSSFS